MGNGERKLKILLVEDNPNDATWLEHLVETSRAYPVHLVPATSVRSALELLEREVPHCVLLDLSLPDSQGLDTVRRLVDADPDTPVVVLTGSDTQMGLDAVRSGAQDFLVKGEVDGDAILRHVLWAVARASVVASRAERAGTRSADARSLVAALTAPAVTFDAELRVVEVNEGFVRLVAALDPLEGSPLTDVVAVDAVFDVVAALRPVVTGAAASVTLRFPLDRGAGPRERVATVARLDADGAVPAPVAVLVVADPQA